ncbi:MAG: hypothetical protein COY58_07595 [Gammaproteobacteria bacterium CG_4_10_14_0_8_um_filter_38_16]|nr:MAG: hypothetical protein COY58_07595 [Gammaproteobacteria bacterium CG_4_10_14_0_8_um_filter_38_16]PJA02681.1 MAG: hypothetical protein COX72_09115 [Gammaproteobacteria bacterium CG_4_10_14_0_2_um_filter_38_22]PJB10859.1 MAG: hypothetical protein CO120_02660 [Gammaproteobacteria bacterium CG_4_9_14_3_um_filter_38_9]
MTTEEKKPNIEQLQQLSIANLLEEGSYPLLLKRSIYFIALILFALILWASFTKLDEVAVSFGEVQPIKEIESVQHLEGGIVAAIYVKNGDEVKKGEKLIKLDPEQVASELQKLSGREASLKLDITRLNAFINETPLPMIPWRDATTTSRFNTPENHEKIEGMLRESMDLLNKQNQERDNQRAIYLEKIHQKKSQLQQFLDSKTELEKKYKLDKQEEEMYGPLVKEGYVSRKEYLTAQRNSIESFAIIKQTDAKINEAKSALEESQNELEKLNNSFKKESLKELNQLNGQLIEVFYNIQRLTALSKRLVVTAPESGIIKGLTLTPGRVIAPGDNILDIVPTNGLMQIECKISPHDIGHVHIGDPAKIRVNAYEFTRYGSVKGTVNEISASTFLNKDELPYYKAKISIEKNYVGDNPKLNQLKPGMTVEVNIVTGKKSVMSYLISPITRGLKSSFRER